MEISSSTLLDLAGHFIQNLFSPESIVDACHLKLILVVTTEQNTYHIDVKKYLTHMHELQGAYDNKLFGHNLKRRRRSIKND